MPMSELPEWVTPGTDVEIVHYNGNGDHISTTPTKIARVLTRDIVLEFDLPPRFTRQMYTGEHFVQTRRGALRPHRYILRQARS